MQQFKAERIFRALDDEPGCEMHVIYHYDDDRGTVSSGPQSGPWRITKQHSTMEGLTHPAQPSVMTTLLLPGGNSAWCARASTLGAAPCAVEFILHHAKLGDDVRMSAGVVHAPDGSLKQLSLIREDSRGPWPSAHWSTDTQAVLSSALDVRAALARAGVPLASHGHGHAISSKLEQSLIRDMPFECTRLATANDDEDVVLLCPDHVALVAPRQRAAGAGFSCAAAWWPPADDGKPPAALLMMEAQWDAEGTLEGVRYVQFSSAPT